MIIVFDLEPVEPNTPLDLECDAKKTNIKSQHEVYHVNGLIKSSQFISEQIMDSWTHEPSGV